MKNPGPIDSDSRILRQKAEKLLQKKTQGSGLKLPSTDTVKLIHELEVHQIELELQIEELVQEKNRAAELAKERYAELYDFAPAGCFTLSREGEILRLNLRGSELFGKERSILKGNRFESFVSGESQTVFKTFLNNLFKSNGWVSCEVSLQVNAAMPVAIHLTGILTEKGEQCLITAVPVTRKRVMEEALLESEGRFRTITENAPNIIMEVDKQGKILFVNKLSYPFQLENVIGRNICDLSPLDYRDEILKALERVFQEGVPQTVKTRGLSKDNEMKWYQSNVSPVIVSGEIKSGIVIVNDISCLVRSEERRLTILNTAMDGFGLLNPEGWILEVNETYCLMTGYSKQELLGMRISELLVEETNAHLHRIREKGEDRFESRQLRKDGRVIAVEVSIQFQPIDGGQFVVFMRDLTGQKQVKEALFQSEDLLKSVMELLPVGVWILNEKGEITSGNAEARNIWAGIKYLGIEHYAKFNGWWLKSGKLIEPNEWAAARAIQNGERSMDEEIGIECFDGTCKIILSSAMPLLNSDGSIRGVIVTNQDITARKRAEEALIELNQELENRVGERTAELLKANAFLQQAEKKYRTVADHTYGWEYWTDPKGNFLYCSPSCERISGYQAADFLKNPGLLSEIVHPEDRKKFLCHKQKEDRGSDGNSDLNYRIVRKDGSVRWMGHVCQPIVDENGNLIGNRGSNRDITKRKNIEQLLLTSSHKYKLLSENIKDGVFICRDGCFEYVNGAMNYIFGYNGRELIDLKLTQLVVPDYLDELEVFHKMKVPTDRIHSIEIECFRKDRSTISAEFLMNYIASEEVIYGVVHDITDKKQVQKNIVKAIIMTEEKERAYFSKELHDGLGPLLSTIKLYLQWSERPNTHLKREEIIRQAEGIIEDALTTVKEISNKLSPHLLTNHGLSSAIQSFTGKIEQSSNIRIDFESDLKRRLGDEIEAAIYRATTECVNNSIKHAKASNISIRIYDTESQLLLHYQDDGIGFQLEETLARKKGLGLFNLQNRIQTIGGKIILFSKPGHGVDYRISISL